jgi:hypothetical protein
MKDGMGSKVAIIVAVIAVAIAVFIGYRSFGGGGGGAGAGETYTAPTTGIDMEQLNANPNSPPGISGAGGGS